MKNNLEQYEDEFSKNLEEKFKKIFAIEYHYDIDNIISTNSKLTSSELDDTLEKLINKYLLKIEEVATMEKYQAVSDKVDEGLEFFVDYKNHHSYDEVFEEAEEIADDLILKILKQKIDILNCLFQFKILKSIQFTIQ